MFMYIIKIIIAYNLFVNIPCNRKSARVITLVICTNRRMRVIIYISMRLFCCFLPL